MKKGTIKSVKKVEYGKYAHGTTFSKGDFIPTVITCIVSVVGGAAFEVSRESILKQFPGRQRITGSLLKKMEGMDPSIFQKKYSQNR